MGYTFLRQIRNFPATGGAPMNITQTFYDSMATQYDKLFLDWQAATRE